MNMANHSASDGRRQPGRNMQRPLMRLAPSHPPCGPSHLASASWLATASSSGAPPVAGGLPVAVPQLWSLVVVALCAYGVTVISVPEPVWASVVPATPKVPATPAVSGRSAPKHAKGHAKAKREFSLADMARPHFMVAPLPTDAALGAVSPTLTKLNVIMPARAWLTPTLPEGVAPVYGHRLTVPTALLRKTAGSVVRSHTMAGRASSKVPAANSSHLAAKSAHATIQLAPAQLPPARLRLAPVSATPTILRAIPIATTALARPPLAVTAAAASPVATSPLAALPLPPNGVPAGQMPDWVSANSKIIKVNALKLPPLSQPLAAPLRAASVSADTSYISSVAPSLPFGAGTRYAQNPNLPPAVTPAQPLTSSERLPNQIEVAVSTFVVLLTTNDLQTVAIADPTIADVSVVNARSVLVNGKTPGITSLVVVDHLKIRQYQVRVVPPQAAPGNRTTDVAAAIGIQGINVRQVRDALVLEGEVATSDEVKRAVEIATIFSPKIVNQLTIRPNDANTPAVLNAGQAADIQSAINIPGVTVREVGDIVILQGTAPSQEQSQSAEKLAAAIAKPKTVVNNLQLPTITAEQAAQAIGATAGGTGGDQTQPNPVVNNPNVGTMLAPRQNRRISVRQVGDTIVLEGIADNAADIEQTAATAARTGLRVINRLTVAPAADAGSGLLTSIAMAINQPGVTVSGSAKRLILQGTVPDTNAAVAAEQIARAFAAQVDNMLTTTHPIQVDVDVSIMEIDKTKLRNLGITFPSLLDAGNGFVFGQIGPDAGFTNPFNPNQPSGPSGPFALNSVTPFQASLRAVVETGNGRLLSNPHATVLSGRTATFQVGGQIPIPQAQTIGAAGQTTAIIFKDYGVLVDVVPSATADGVVTMRLRTEVSQPDYSTGFAVPGGGTIPGFSRRAAVTEVTVPPRGTIALAGLIQHNVTELIRKVPVLSKIPILGALFTSRRFQRNETELVIFVTPRVLPNPLPVGISGPAAPYAVGNNTNAATVLGNPGIPSFNTNSNFTSPGAGGGSGGGQ